MDNRPIGVFDSGVGGLTVLREIIKEVPNESTVYFGDTERFPYGPKNLRDVKDYVFKASGFLEKKGIKILVIACNTGSVAALEELKQTLKIPVIGVIEPGARTAVNNTKNKRVGVIATEGTVDSRAYEKEINKIDTQIQTFSVAAPILIEYIEKGILTGKNLNEVIKTYLEPLFKHNIDVLVLGCTHFPLIEKQILEVSSNDFKVISSAVETAKDVKKLLIEENLLAEEYNTAIRIFYETAQNGNFFKTGKMFLGSEIKEVIRTRLEI
ncbi:glutamate racemase [Actinomycetota bacterium]